MTRAKHLAAYAAVVAALPYLVLKAVWLAGGTVGVKASTPDGAMLDTLNAVTMLMDATAILLALAFVSRWGRRLAAAPVLFPMWVGTGFLGPIVLAVVPAVLIGAARGVNVFTAGGGIVEPWVYEMVYAGFIVQGLALLTAFTLYARERWPRLPAQPLPAELRLLAAFMVVLQAATGVICLYWGFGGTAGLPDGADGFTGRFLQAVFGLLSIGAAVGLARTRRGFTWRTFALIWVGAGADFAWGLWLILNMVVDSPLGGGSRLGLLGLVSLFRLMSGTVVGMLAAVALTTRRAAPDPSGAPEPAVAAARTGADERLGG
ncbi:hypothetical protein [Hamadaea tsunoensis]|uniref:hypothetical protein n=1 Tax=Hamadaea tsunoensis TaxID=53368 RepID=UPI000419894A|nr:hypothetical protein [Hamadaea tsunoensis]